MVVKLLAGGGFFLLLPRDGIIEGSTRIIPFFALLMAGVLPAMMQTVTALKGDDLSIKAINEYKDSLDELLKFWASIFGSALLAIGSLTLAFIISKSQSLIWLPFGYYLSRNFLIDSLIFFFGISATSVLMRFSLAYGGLRSLLKLNFHFAEKKGQKNLAEAVSKLTKDVAEPSIRRLD